MFGNKKYILLIVIVFSFSNILLAGSRIPAKDFRIGINIEGGVKFIGPTMFHGKTGIVLKFNETFSLIPYVGVYPNEQTYEETHEYWNSRTMRYEYKTYTETDDDVTVDAGITLRFEYPSEIVRRSTSYEYDIDEQKFLHHYYYSAFRPFWQLHLGTFLGAGGGFLYYFNGTISMGLNVDVGYNLAAEEGFGVSPKLVIAMSF
ncbi:MAG: hypothetical protein K8R79_09445 [Calditrichales bacterium]|nr:hypothetical protein [Calditrichales bacterium]